MGLSPVESAGMLPMGLRLPEHWPAQADLLNWCQSLHPLAAVMLLLLGIVYLLFGWYLFRVLLTFNATVAGALLGAMVGKAIGSMAAGALLGGFLTAIITWPLMKYTVAATGALFGAILGASIWHAAGLEMAYVPAGAAIGLVFLGLLSFIIFRASVTFYTSLQGSGMTVMGLLGLIYKIRDAGPTITDGLSYKPYVLPMIFFIATVMAFAYQQTQFKDEPEK
jgi:hypothetical protein